MAASSLCVLLAESNPVNQAMLRHMLEKLGHSVVIADHGAHVLELAATHDVHLVLMNMHLSVMNAATAVRLIRMLPGDKARLPLVALIPENDDEAEKNCLADGLDAILPQPVTVSRLAATLEWAVGGADDNSPALDPDYIEDMRQWVGDSTVLALLAAAPQSFREELSRITAAWEAGDSRTVRENAHRLKGAAGSVGCRRLSETAQAIQKGDPSDLSDRHLLDRLTAEVDRAIAAAATWRPQD